MFGFSKRKKRFTPDRDSVVSVFQAILNRLCEGPGDADTFDVIMIDEGDGTTASISVTPSTRHAVVSINPIITSRPNEDLWTALAHELGHSYADGKGHGPEWFAWMLDRGITVNTVTIEGREVQGEPHRIIRGGRLDRLRNKWHEEHGVEPDSMSEKFEPRMIDFRDVSPTRYSPPVPFTENPAAMAYIARNPPSGPTTPDVYSRGYAAASRKAQQKGMENMTGRASGWSTPPSGTTHLDQSGNISAPVTDLTGWTVALDVSASMDYAVTGSNSSRLGVAKQQLRSYWPEGGGARLLTFSQVISEYDSPKKIPILAESGTLYGILFHAIADSGNSEQVLIISDGDLVDDDKYSSQETRETEESVLAARQRAIDSGVRVISAIFIGEINDPGFSFMRKLCYGGGVCTAALDPGAMEQALNASMKGARAVANNPLGAPSVTAAARHIADLTPSIQQQATHLKHRVEIDSRVVELGQTVADVVANVHELQGRTIISESFTGLHAQAAGMAVDAIQNQRAQEAVDATAQEQSLAALRGSLQEGGQRALGQVKAGYEGMILNHAAKVAALPVHGSAGGVYVKDTRLDESVYAKARALLSAQRQGQAQESRVLPAPAREAHPLPPPVRETRMLPPPNQHVATSPILDGGRPLFSVAARRVRNDSN